MSDILFAAIGGVFIGIAAVLLMATHGRIMGISGVVSGSLFADKGDKVWRLVIVAGMLTPPLILAPLNNTPRVYSNTGMIPRS